LHTAAGIEAAAYLHVGAGVRRIVQARARVDQ
jgi:hypothetical protein